ncbi:MAG: hypothetical protein QM811_27705 [Pirellulales bacterium]
MSRFLKLRTLDKSTATFVVGSALLATVVIACCLGEKRNTVPATSVAVSKPSENVSPTLDTEDDAVLDVQEQKRSSAEKNVFRTASHRKSLNNTSNIAEHVTSDEHIEEVAPLPYYGPQEADPNRIPSWAVPVVMTEPQRAVHGGMGKMIGNPHGANFHGKLKPSDIELAAFTKTSQPPRLRQSNDEAFSKSWGCVTCHINVPDMHNDVESVRLGCVDCHGGDANTTDKHKAHVKPCFPEAWGGSGNPVRSYNLLNYESPEFIRFVNPGDLRVAHISCGDCHPKEVLHVKKSMMTHGAMLWGAALYNNGSIPNKAAMYGESYSMNGVSQRMQTVPPPTPAEMEFKGVVPFLDPLPRFEISQPGNVLRIFERGGRFRPETGIPERLEESGRPRTRLSNRGLGTENRTDPVFIGLTKTRLFDPTLNFMGTNDHPGDFRSSGCTACHVIYANDRSPIHSGPYAVHGNRGMASATSPIADPTIPKNEPGHPIEHRFAKGNSIPTSQCMICHMHPGTTVMNSYIGYMWWDEESDAELIYPARQKYPTAEEVMNVQMRNPNESAQRSNLADPEFVANLTDLNTLTRHNQFADFHGHGWAYRAVYKRDRKGNFLNNRGDVVGQVDNAAMRAAVEVVAQSREPHRNAANKTDRVVRNEEFKLECEKQGLPVHLLDIHIEKGMHCIDCHFIQDMHGNGRLQREVRAAVEIRCEDCHGTATDKITETPSMFTTGPASYTSGEKGRDLNAMRSPSGRPRFERENGKLYQNSMVEKDLRWEIIQVKDTITPGSDRYNVRSHLAKTVKFNDQQQLQWGGQADHTCADTIGRMSCIACHTSWNPSCFGCHLPQKANHKAPSLHHEGDVSRNLTAYNFQTLRDDVYMLAHDGDVTGNRIGPSRSSCAIHVTSYNNNREAIYISQQTISADGPSGIAFSTNVPHTVRGGSKIPAHPSFVPPNREVKQCTDCHVSKDNDNNAIMAQLLMQGTNYVNFIGRYCWVGAGEHGLEGVVVTEQDEPQTVIGSSFHRTAYPDRYREHVERGGLIEHAHEHPGIDISDAVKQKLHKHNEVLSLQARGEYLYAACGEGGFRVFDIAFIDDKAFSERITTAPVSPMGQKFYVETKFATAVAAPTTIAPDPTRKQNPNNKEPAIHAMYAYIYVVDKYEGLITVGAGTLLDGNPLNNFLKREITFNPDGILCGAKSITILGTYAYICCDEGLVVVSIDDPKCPKVTCVLGHEHLHHPHAFQAQFRYGYVCDEEGIKVLDVTDLAHPRVVSKMPLHEAHNIYLARTYAYVAAGCQGLVILDITKPEMPFVDQVFNADGCINDLHDVKLGITYTSEFAYLADGKNGMRVVQLTSPETPGNMGFSPRPTPRLIATRKLPKEGHAHCISEGVDRDRAVDESGNQIAVFGRIGARPLSLAEQHKMYLRNGYLWQVSDDPFDNDYLYDPNIKAGFDKHFKMAMPERVRPPKSYAPR